MPLYASADYRPYDPAWRASHGYPPLAPGMTGFEIPSPLTKMEAAPSLGAPDAIPPPIGGANTAVTQAREMDDRARVMGRPNSGESSYLSAYDNGISQKYNAFAEEARQQGITDPAAIDQYAMEHNRQYWSDQSATGGGYLEKHPWMAPVGVLTAGLGAAALGGSSLFGGAAGGAAEGTAGSAVGGDIGTAGTIGADATSASTAATGVAPAATQGFVGSDVAAGAAGIGGEAPVTDFFSNTGVDEFGNPTQSNFQGGPGTPGSSDFFNPGGTPGGLPAAPPGATSVPPGTQSALEKVFGKGIMAAIGNNPAVAAALAAGVLEKSNNPLTQPTIDAIKGAIASGQSIQGMQIPGITPSLQRAIDTANTNVGAWKPALDEAGAFTRSGGAPITAEDTARYMNPYIDQALAPAARKVSEAAAAQRMSDAAKAGSRGAFGTERNDQIAGLNKRNELMSLGDVYGTGYANAFNTALNTAGADKSRALSAGGAFGNLATTTSALGGKDVEGLTSAGGIESLPFTEELTKQKTAGDVLSGAGNAGARAIGSTGQPSLLTNLTGAAGVLGAFDKLGGSTPSVPSLPSIPGIGSPAATPSLPAPSNNPFDDSNAGVFGS